MEIGLHCYKQVLFEYVKMSLRQAKLTVKGPAFLLPLLIERSVFWGRVVRSNKHLVYVFEDVQFENFIYDGVVVQVIILPLMAVFICMEELGLQEFQVHFFLNQVLALYHVALKKLLDMNDRGGLITIKL